MKALAWISLVLTVLVGADGIYMLATHYQPSNVNNFHLSDGGTVIIAADILLVVTVIAFILSSRTNGVNSANDSRSNGLKESR